MDASIHMLFVRMELAVFWIDDTGRIVDKICARPWRPIYIPKVAARYILETSMNYFDEFEIGDEVYFK